MKVTNKMELSPEFQETFPDQSRYEGAALVLIIEMGSKIRDMERLVLQDDI